MFRSIRVAQQRAGTIYLRSDLRLHRARLRTYAVTMVAITLISSALAIFFASKLHRLIANPILELTELARTITAEKNYSLRAMPRSSDEIGLLAETFNQTLTQVEERERALQQTQQR